MCASVSILSCPINSIDFPQLTRLFVYIRCLLSAYFTAILWLLQADRFFLFFIENLYFVKRFSLPLLFSGGFAKSLYFFDSLFVYRRPPLYRLSAPLLVLGGFAKSLYFPGPSTLCWLCSADTIFPSSLPDSPAFCGKIASHLLSWHDFFLRLFLKPLCYVEKIVSPLSFSRAPQLHFLSIFTAILR